MMKLKTLFYMFGVSSFLFSSCSEIPNYQQVLGERIFIYRQDNINSYVEISSEDELNSLARYDDCCILITSPTCTACQNTLIELSDLIEKEHYIIYTVDYESIYREAMNSAYNSQGKYAYLFPRLNQVPTFLFYRDGRLIDYRIGSFKEGELEEGLEEYFFDANLYYANDLIAEGGHYKISHLDLENITYSSTYLDSLSDEKVVLYTWRRCGDCYNYKERVLFDFLVENETVKLYVYELDDFMLLRREDEEKRRIGSLLFSDFSAKYHLNAYSRLDEFSNEIGFAPTIINYTNNSYILSVYSNDRDVYIDENNYLAYNTTFYEEVKDLRSDTKVDNFDYTSSNYQKALEELNQKALILEDKLCLEFLNLYLL